MEPQADPRETAPKRRAIDNFYTRSGFTLPFYYRRTSDKVFIVIFIVSAILFNYYSLHDLQGDAAILRIMVFFVSLVFAFIVRAIAVRIYALFR